MPVSIGLAHELRQVMREAIANAARHGDCGQVIVSVSTGGAGLTLRIADDGEGFPGDRPAIPPPLDQRAGRGYWAERFRSAMTTPGLCSKSPCPIG
jgi:anti-sigma regulatory factor (Ser/Thr protein kinase)